MHRKPGIPATGLLLALLAGCSGADRAVAPESPDALAAAKPPGGIPSDLTAVALSGSQIALAWLDNSRNETGFEVHRSTTGASGSFTLLVSLGADSRFYTDGGLPYLSQRCYRVKVILSGARPASSTFSNVACATTLAPPPPPPPPRVSWAWAEDLNGTSVTVKWTDMWSETGYRIERSADGVGSWEPAGVVGADVTTFTAVFPVWYRVVAFNASGDTAPSDPVPTAPGMPTDLHLVILDDDNFELTWRDNSGIETAYTVWFGGAALEDWDDLFLVAELPPDATSYRATMTGIGQSTYPYLFKVMARKDSLYSAFAEVYVPQAGS